MIILGIDVGFAITGWSIIEKEKSYKNGMNLVDYGAIITEPKQEISLRLKQIYEGVVEVIKKYKPDIMAVESIFFFKNQKTVIDVSQARGVILLAGEQSNLEIKKYTPLQVKTSVTSYGRADKSQVQKMVKMIFSLEEIPKPDDVADAIAVAVCECSTNNYKKI